MKIRFFSRPRLMHDLRGNYILSLNKPRTNYRKTFGTSVAFWFRLKGLAFFFFFIRLVGPLLSNQWWSKKL